MSGWVNPVALRRAKTLWSFGLSECNMVKHHVCIVCVSLQSSWKLVSFYSSRFVSIRTWFVNRRVFDQT